jgi:hypothetical protein
VYVGHVKYHRIWRTLKTVKYLSHVKQLRLKTVREFKKL